MQKHYGHLLRILHWCTDQTMTNALCEMDLTAAHGHIMGFLAHRKQQPCSRDIEEAFHLSHPTVSGLLARLEKKGFIEIRPDEQDRRCKRIYVLPKGQECNEMMHNTIRSNEKRIVHGVYGSGAGAICSVSGTGHRQYGRQPLQKTEA